MFKYINNLVKKIRSSEKGQGMVEYALVIAFVAAIAIYFLGGDDETTLRGAISGAFTSASETLNSAGNAVVEGGQ